MSEYRGTKHGQSDNRIAQMDLSHRLHTSQSQHGQQRKVEVQGGVIFVVIGHCMRVRQDQRAKVRAFARINVNNARIQGDLQKRRYKPVL